MSTDSQSGELFTAADVQLADSSNVWSGACGDPAVHPGHRIDTYGGAGDTGPRAFIARVTSDVRAVVIALSDGTREDPVLHRVADAGTGIGVLVYRRDLDIHRIDLVDSGDQPLPLEA